MDPRTIILASMGRALIASLLAKAGINPNAENVASSNQPGELIIRTPEKQTIADNDETILELARQLCARNKQLVGMYVRVYTTGYIYVEGTILDFSSPSTPGFACVLEPGPDLQLEHLFIPNILVILAKDKAEAEKMLLAGQGKPEDATPPVLDANP